MMKQLVCLPKILQKSMWVAAAKVARSVNPVNHPPIERLSRTMPGFTPTPEHIAVLTSKYWHAGGVKLTVGFLDAPSRQLRKRILSHMNAWAASSNVSFTESRVDPQVRIAREGGANGGYWSYLGTDILMIDRNEPTMNLEGFTMQTDESEFHRVVRHETGHTMGFPHEHMRRELVARIDSRKAIEFFGQTQGWSPEEVRAQVLTPIEDASLLGTESADENSIMCYQIPGALTVDGQPILGGTDIDELDFAFAAQIYPRPAELPKRQPALAPAQPSESVLCFTPGTSPEYIASVVAALRDALPAADEAALPAETAIPQLHRSNGHDGARPGYPRDPSPSA
jgi:hypothetical protein